MEHVMNKDVFRQEMQAIRDYLAAAEDALRSGFMPDIAALAPRVATLCSELRMADAEVQKEAGPELTTLLKDLDACEQSLRAWKENRSGA
jgi:rubrerythrin